MFSQSYVHMSTSLNDRSGLPVAAFDLNLSFGSSFLTFVRTSRHQLSTDSLVSNTDVVGLWDVCDTWLFEVPLMYRNKV